LSDDEIGRAIQIEAAKQKRDSCTQRLFTGRNEVDPRYPQQQLQPGPSGANNQQPSQDPLDTVVIFVEKQYRHARSQLVTERRNTDQPVMGHYEVFVRKASFNTLMLGKQGIGLPRFAPENLHNFKTRNGVGGLTTTLNNEIDFRLKPILIRNVHNLHALVSGITYRVPKVLDVFPIEAELRAIQFTLQRPIEYERHLDVPTLYTINVLSLGPMNNEQQRNDEARRLGAKAMKRMRDQSAQFKNFFIEFYEAQQPPGSDHRDFQVRRHKLEPNGIDCSSSFMHRPA